MDKISDLKQIVIKTLDINKAQDIISIDLKDKSSMADFMIIASGTSSRHIQSLSEQVLEKLKDNGIENSKIEGKDSNEWKLVDGIDLIVHIFHPEKRKFYELEKIVLNTLDLNKAQDIISINLKDKSSMADYMIIASGTSSRHIQSLSEQVLEKFKDNGIKDSKIEGKESSEWKLVDGIDVIVHIFHPEKRKFYELEKIWSELIPKEKVMI